MASRTPTARHGSVDIPDAMMPLLLRGRSSIHRTPAHRTLTGTSHLYWTGLGFGAPLKDDLYGLELWDALHFRHSASYQQTYARLDSVPASTVPIDVGLPSSAR